MPLNAVITMLPTWLIAPMLGTRTDLPFAQLACQYRDLVAQDQDLGVLVR